MEAPASFEAYVEMLKCHDWDFRKSSDVERYQRGRAERMALMEARPLFDPAWTSWNSIAPETSSAYVVRVPPVLNEEQANAMREAWLANKQLRAGFLQPDIEAERTRFEERAYASYFAHSVIRNPNPPRGTGALDFIPKPDIKTKAALLEREGKTYKDDNMCAMWHGWKLAKGLE